MADTRISKVVKQVDKVISVELLAVSQEEISMKFSASR